jgi:hypothetical protein
MYTDEEWKEARQGWVANHLAIRRTLELVRRDYKPRSDKNKKIKAVIRREESELNLILLVIDELEDMDKVLHEDKTGSHSQPS